MEDDFEFQGGKLPNFTFWGEKLPFLAIFSLFKLF
jgi:hypothetical protein